MEKEDSPPSTATNPAFAAKKMLAEVDSHITDRVVLFKNENFDAKLLLNPYQASWFQQFTALLWRSWHAIAKNPLVAQIRMVEVIVRPFLDESAVTITLSPNQSHSLLVSGFAGGDNLLPNGL